MGRLPVGTKALISLVSHQARCADAVVAAIVAVQLLRIIEAIKVTFVIA